MKAHAVGRRKRVVRLPAAARHGLIAGVVRPVIGAVRAAVAPQLFAPHPHRVLHSVLGNDVLRLHHLFRTAGRAHHPVAAHLVHGGQVGPYRGRFVAHGLADAHNLVRVGVGARSLPKVRHRVAVARKRTEQGFLVQKQILHGNGRALAGAGRAGQVQGRAVGKARAAAPALAEKLAHGPRFAEHGLQLCFHHAGQCFVVRHGQHTRRRSVVDAPAQAGVQAQRFARLRSAANHDFLHAALGKGIHNARQIRVHVAPVSRPGIGAVRHNEMLRRPARHRRDLTFAEYAPLRLSQREFHRRPPRLRPRRRPASQIPVPCSMRPSSRPSRHPTRQ